MKITEKQLLMLLDITKASTLLPGSFGGYSPEDRIRLVNEIINQQSNELEEVKGEHKNIFDKIL